MKSGRCAFNKESKRLESFAGPSGCVFTPSHTTAETAKEMVFIF
jgi:hypothetical protein